MKKSTLVALGVAAAALVAVAVTSSVQRRTGTDEAEAESSPCLTEATIQ